VLNENASFLTHKQLSEVASLLNAPPDIWLRRFLEAVETAQLSEAGKCLGLARNRTTEVEYATRRVQTLPVGKGPPR
jgi:hypothetical protein